MCFRKKLVKLNYFLIRSTWFVSLILVVSEMCQPPRWWRWAFSAWLRNSTFQCRFRPRRRSCCCKLSFQFSTGPLFSVGGGGGDVNFSRSGKKVKNTPCPAVKHFCVLSLGSLPVDSDKNRALIHEYKSGGLFCLPPSHSVSVKRTACISLIAASEKKKKRSRFWTSLWWRLDVRTFLSSSSVHDWGLFW